MTQVSTRRALEVCMSRLPMHAGSRQWFASMLSSVIDKDVPEPVDLDRRRATLMRALAELEYVSEDFQKTALLGRVRTAARLMREVLEE